LGTPGSTVVTTSNKNLNAERPSKHEREGVHVDEKSVDVENASWDQSLSKVWTDPLTGELCASVDRILFESPLSVAIKFMEPQGFQLNLENILACLDSMKFSIITKPDLNKDKSGRFPTRKIAPSLYMRLPQKTAKGPLLNRFYDEISRYESELSRLQQYEAQSRRVVQEAIKDDTGKSALIQLQKDNQSLREEIERLSRKVSHLASTINSVPIASKETLLPAGARLTQVRQVTPEKNIVHFKSDSGQYSYPLSLLNGTPQVGARAISMHEGGQIRGVFVIDPTPTPFTFLPAEVLVSDGSRIKVRTNNRADYIFDCDSSRSTPQTGQSVLLVISGTLVLDWSHLMDSALTHLIDSVYDRQTTSQIRGDSSNTEAHVVMSAAKSKSIKKRRVA